MPGITDIPGDHVVTLDIAAGGASGGTTVVPQAGAFRAPAAGVVTAAYWTPSAAVTHGATNFCTLAVQNYGPAGAGTAKPATRSYVAGDSVAQVPEAMTLDATVANRQFAAGDILIPTMKDATATGLALPAGTITLHVAWR